MGVGVLCVSLASIFIRLADTDPLTVAAYRMTIASVVVSAVTVSLARNQLSAVKRGDLPLLGVSGVFLAAHFALWITSLSHTSVASSVLLVTTTPVFVAAAAVLYTNDRIGRVTAAAILASMAGGAVLAAGDWAEGEQHLSGDALALAGAVAVAGYLIVGRKVRGRIPNLPYITVVYAAAAVVLVVAAIVSGAPMLGLPMETYFWMAMAALVPQAIGHSLLNWSLAYWPATNVTLAVRAEPVIATLLAIPVLGEVPPWTVVPGGALVMLGVYLAVKSESSHRPDV